jgi:hypothetical protein
MYRKWYRSTQIDYTSFERDTEDIEQIDVTGIGTRITNIAFIANITNAPLQMARRLR